MKLYLISQCENNNYDTYSDVVVCASNREEAQNMNPLTGLPMTEKDWSSGLWCSSLEMVRAKCIGEAAKDVRRGIVCSSFRCGSHILDKTGKIVNKLDRGPTPITKMPAFTPHSVLRRGFCLLVGLGLLLVLINFLLG